MPSGRGRGSYWSRMTKKDKKILGRNLTILVVACLGIGLIMFFALSPLSPFLPEETTTPVAASTFTIYSSVDGEDVSDFVELTIWVPKDNDDIEDIEDVCTLSNFETEVTDKDADDISLDITDYLYIWVEIDDDGDSVFENEFLLFAGGANSNFNIYAHDHTSDVNFNMFVRDTMAAVTVASYQTDGNFSIIMDCDHHVQTNCHYGSGGWDIDQDDFDDMTTEERETEIFDQAVWNSQAPLYDPTVDLEKDYDDELEMLTNAFALDLDFNTTISTTDGEATQINCTLEDDIPAEVVISGDSIYIIFYEEIKFNNGPYDFCLEITFGADIELSDIDSGRIVVPRDDDNLGAFTKYSDIGA